MGSESQETLNLGHTFIALSKIHCQNVPSGNVKAHRPPQLPYVHQISTPYLLKVQSRACVIFTLLIKLCDSTGRLLGSATACGAMRQSCAT